MAVSQLRTTGDGHEPPPRPPKPWSPTARLTAVLVGGFALQFGQGVTPALAFSVSPGLYGCEAWRWLTYAALHADPSHLLIDLIAVRLFGPPLVARIGGRGLAIAFAVGAIGGVLGHLLLWQAGLFGVTTATPLVGAGGGVLALAVVAAGGSPDRRPAVWLYLGWFVLDAVWPGPTAAGAAAHLGGAILGLAIAPVAGRFGVRPLPPRRFWRPGDPASNFFRPDA